MLVHGTKSCPYSSLPPPSLCQHTKQDTVEVMATDLRKSSDTDIKSDAKELTQFIEKGAHPTSLSLLFFFPQEAREFGSW